MKRNSKQIKLSDLCMPRFKTKTTANEKYKLVWGDGETNNLIFVYSKDKEGNLVMYPLADVSDLMAIVTDEDNSPYKKYWDKHIPQADVDKVKKLISTKVKDEIKTLGRASLAQSGHINGQDSAMSMYQDFRQNGLDHDASEKLVVGCFSNEAVLLGGNVDKYYQFDLPALAALPDKAKQESQATQARDQVIEVETEVSETSESVKPKSISQMNKSELQDLCLSKGFDITDDMTKKQLVLMLQSVA